MWILQYSTNEYNQQGFYSIRHWNEKPTLLDLAGKPLDEIDVEQLKDLKELYSTGYVKVNKESFDIANEYRLVETEKDGTIPYEFD
jgi:hypothetical protein